MYARRLKTWNTTACRLVLAPERQVVPVGVSQPSLSRQHSMPVRSDKCKQIYVKYVDGVELYRGIARSLVRQFTI